MSKKPKILTFYIENYVNELSKWMAYFIFCLAWFFSKMLAVPHRHQVKKYIVPQNEKTNRIPMDNYEEIK
ncbi:hypothetical protein ACFQZ1_10520, partial [Bacillus sp. CGMCC 1.60114]